MTSKELYDMELHECRPMSKTWNVLRVPGGWIYIQIYPSADREYHTFVPYDNEFSDYNNLTFPR